MGEWPGRRGAHKGTEAAKEFQKAIELDPSFEPSYVGLAAALSQIGKWDEALNALKTSVNKEPNDARAYYEMGSILTQRGDFIGAAQIYNRLGGNGDRSISLYSGLAELYLKENKLSAAIDNFQKAIRLDPENFEAQSGLANTLLKRVQDSLKALPGLAETSLEKRQADEAAKEFQKAIKLAPLSEPHLSEPLYVGLGHALALEGISDQALDALRSAINLDLEDAGAYFEMGFIYARTGMEQEAQRTFEKASTLYSASPELKALIQTAASKKVNSSNPQG